MREIKFRAWHVNRNRFIDFGLMIRPNGRVYSTVKYEIWDDFTDEVEVTQYTGLDDALGHQIYEGDILRDPDDSRFCYEVEYDYGRFSCGDNDLIDCLGCNVVGNVFENPELLEVTE